MLRRLVVPVVVFVAATALIASVASAGAAIQPGGKIGPHQLFVGLVNGNSGLNGPAQIKVACPGPIRPGETTHPLGHQPLSVTRPEVVRTKDGNTGAHGTHISAFLGIPPASATGGGIASFAYYNVSKPIPTTLNVPCSGSGYITFIPFPRDPGTSRSYVVPVEYVNIAV